MDDEIDDSVDNDDCVDNDDNGDGDNDDGGNNDLRVSKARLRAMSVISWESGRRGDMMMMMMMKTKGEMWSRGR